MRTDRGFTLIELAIVLAVAAILAAVGGSYIVAGRRNVGVQTATTGVQMRLEQLQYIALSQQTTQLLVLADAPNNSTDGCSAIGGGGCARVFHLRGPNASWRLKDFDVAHPGTNVDAVEDEERLTGKQRFYLAGAGAALPKPFDAYGTKLKVFDRDLLTACAGERVCLGYRFLSDGTVAVEYPDPAAATTAAKAGHAFALASELTGAYQGAQQFGVLVAVPSGITRLFPVP